MFVATVLICGSIAYADCRGYNAEGGFRIPGESATPVVCFLDAQAYVARSGFAKLASQMKIVCGPAYLQLPKERAA